jgi:superfamily II DNA/RNA helicase
VSRPATAATTITQLKVATGRDPHDKRETLRRLIREADNFKNAIVFCNRKREVALLHRSLVRHKFNAVALHGDLDQSARTAALDAFRSGEAKLLIASDVAARGLDIPDVSHVFNFDVPHHADDYVHRIGRTGRAGKSGVAISIVAPMDGKSIDAIEKLTGQTIPWMDKPAAEAPRQDDVAPAREAKPHGRHPRERSGGRGERPDRSRRSSGGVKRPQPVEQRAQAAEPSAKRPLREFEEADTSHLPAFLLRPIPARADQA